MKYEIVGAGAVGLLLAGQLALSGEKVRIWARTREQAELIEMNGISLKEEETASPQLINRNISSAFWSREEVDKAQAQEAGEEDSMILLTVKQRALDEPFCELLSVLHNHALPVVCFQNGMGHLEKLGKWIKEGYLWAAVTTEGAKRTDKRSVIHAGHGQTRIGSISAGNEVRLQKLTEQFSAAGFTVFVSKNILQDMYRKLLINAAINPLTALWRIRNGGLLKTERRRELLRQLIKEGTAVYDACGIPYDKDIAEQIEEVCRQTQDNISSMLADVLKNEPTEVEYINGYLVGMALNCDVAVPSHELILQLVKGINESG